MMFASNPHFAAFRKKLEAEKVYLAPLWHWTDGRIQCFRVDHGYTTKGRTPFSIIVQDDGHDGFKVWFASVSARIDVDVALLAGEKA